MKKFKNPPTAKTLKKWLARETQENLSREEFETQEDFTPEQYKVLTGAGYKIETSSGYCSGTGYAGYSETVVTDEDGSKVDIFDVYDIYMNLL